MDNFTFALNQTLKFEGGYNEIQGDAGGATNYGISLRYLKDLYKNDNLVDINHDGSIDKTDIKNLTKESASKIYFNEFWLKNKCDKIIDVNLAAKLFDMSVNMGNKQAAKLLQLALQLTGHDIVIDGILGNKSLEAINKSNPLELMVFLKYQCINFYLKLVETNPAYQKFIRGWLRRAVN